MNSFIFGPNDSADDDYDYDDKDWEDVLEDIYADLGLNLTNDGGAYDE